MRNPFNNKNYLNHLKLLGFLATILFALLLVYLLMWNPYSLYFERPEFSSTLNDQSELVANLFALFNSLILLGLTIFSIIKFWKKKKLVIWTPLVSIVTLLLLTQLNEYHPDQQFEYTKDGYRYLEQRWHLDGNNTFKRFKSDKPINDYKDDKNIIWELDSISE